jgi:hypothetical protein
MSIRRRGKHWEVTAEVGRDGGSGKRLRRTRLVEGTKKEAERVQAEILQSLHGGTLSKAQAAATQRLRGRLPAAANDTRSTDARRGAVHGAARTL